MARNTKNDAALAHTEVEPVDTHDAMHAAVRAFIREHFPKSQEAALVVAPGYGLPAVVIGLTEDGCIPNCIGTDDLVRVG